MKKTCSIKLDIIYLKLLDILMKNRLQTIRNCINLVMFQETLKRYFIRE